MVETRVLGSEVGAMGVRAASGKERSWREELYNRDSRDSRR